MRGPEFLRQRVGKLKSRMGGVVPGSHASIRGLDLHSTFKDAEWMDLYMFAITGRRFSTAELSLLQSIWTYTSYPDARVWNNRVAALAGSARGTGNLALSAALAVSEATVYGRGVDIRAITFLKETLQAVAHGGSLSECVRTELDIHRSIAGYGRPLTSSDERIIPITQRARQLGLDQGSHLKLAFEIDNYLVESRLRMRINYGAVAAGLIADLGLLPREYYLYLFPAFLAGIFPCYIEAAGEPEGALFPIPCEDIEYAGRERRRWARRYEKELGDSTAAPPTMSTGVTPGE
jgi:hypothetical protein